MVRAEALKPRPGVLAVDPYVPGRSKLAGAGPVIKLSSNETPLGPSPHAVEAFREAASGLYRYPDGSYTSLREALGAFYGLNPAHIVCGNGSDELFHVLAQAYLGPGDEAIYTEHGFLVYRIAILAAGAEPVIAPERNLTANADEILGCMTPRTRAVFIANPNNPTGTLAPADEVLRLIQGLPPEVVLVVDEAYREYQEQPLDLLPYIRNGQHPNLVLVRTFSKIYGLAGLRLGYGLGHRDLIGALEKVRAPFNTNHLAQVAALAALDDREHLQKTRANNTAGLRFLEAGFRRLGLEYVPSSANFILVRVGDGPAVCQALQRLGVITRPLANYQLPEFLRITVGTPAENTRCLAAMATVCGQGAEARAPSASPTPN